MREIMKTPTDGALFLLNNSIAPADSGRKATLLDASEQNGMYQFEYRVDRGERGPPLQAISVLVDDNGYIYTLTVVAREADWRDNPSLALKLRKVASSFHLR